MVNHAIWFSEKLVIGVRKRAKTEEWLQRWILSSEYIGKVAKALGFLCLFYFVVVPFKILQLRALSVEITFYNNSQPYRNWITLKSIPILTKTRTYHLVINMQSSALALRRVMIMAIRRVKEASSPVSHRKSESVNVKLFSRTRLNNKNVFWLKLERKLKNQKQQNAWKNI